MRTARSFVTNILDLDFSFTDPVTSLQANGSGAQILANNEGIAEFNVGDATEVIGVVECANGVTLTLEWGFKHNTKVGPNPNDRAENYGVKKPVKYVAKDSISVTGGWESLVGSKINVRVAAPILRVRALNASTATSNFRIWLAKIVY